MRKVELPITSTVSFNFSYDPLNSDIKDPIGEIGENEWENLNIARENGGKVLLSAVSIEQAMESILLTYFMGFVDGYSEKRELFRSELLQSSNLQLSAKRHLILKVASKFKAFKGSDRNTLEHSLKKVIQWRNAFAHGYIILDSLKGATLKYYSGGQKTQVLDDEFWESIETFFNTSNDLLEKLSKVEMNS